jgi:signal transduction histidine kinase
MSDPQAERIAELERQLAQVAEQAAAARRELEAFTYAVSHDLRAPLRSLSGFSQALIELPNANLDPKAKHYLDRIQQAGRKMSELIDALLSLSRVSRADVQLRSFDLTRLCEEAATAVGAKYPDRSVQLRIAPNMTATGDSRLLRTAIELLLDNAWKFTASATDAQVGITQAVTDGECIVCVRDNGVGFDPIYAEKLFRPFQRLHADPQFPGLGIGLATAQRIVARHNGRIWAEAKPEHGAAFYFSVPRLTSLPTPQEQGRELEGKPQPPPE